MTNKKENEKNIPRTLENVCDESDFCLKMPENIYDYCGVGFMRKVECSKQAMNPDYTGHYPCFKYPRNPGKELIDGQGGNA
ncbi:MAG: hypothetical protein AABX88_01005 [Nanoarchaeota archaeon]